MLHWEMKKVIVIVFLYSLPFISPPNKSVEWTSLKNHDLMCYDMKRKLLLDLSSTFATTVIEGQIQKNNI